MKFLRSYRKVSWCDSDERRRLFFMQVFDVALHERDNDCHDKKKDSCRKCCLVDDRIEVCHSFLLSRSNETAMYEDSIKFIILFVNSSSLREENITR